MAFRSVTTLILLWFGEPGVGLDGALKTNNPVLVYLNRQLSRSAITPRPLFFSRSTSPLDPFQPLRDFSALTNLIDEALAAQGRIQMGDGGGMGDLGHTCN